MQKALGVAAVGFVTFFLLALTQNKDQQGLSYSNLKVSQIAGKNLFGLKDCTGCHTLADKADGKLTPVTNRRSGEWFVQHVEEKSEVVLQETKSARRKKRVLRDEITALENFLFRTSAMEKKEIADMRENVFQGAYLVYQNNCLNCHKIAGEGKEVAPDLTHVAEKHTKEWFVKNLQNPQQFAPESPMPKFDSLPAESLYNIADYLQTLKK